MFDMKSAIDSTGGVGLGSMQPLSWRESMIRLLQGHEDVPSMLYSDAETDAEKFVASDVKTKWTNTLY
jgi:hypothetical protein